MLNYIWAGLIIFSFAFALWNDVSDIRDDKFRNGRPLPVIIESTAGSNQVSVRIDPVVYKSHFGVDEPIGGPLSATLLTSEKGRELKFDAKATLPPRIETIREVTAGSDVGMFKASSPKPLLAKVTRFDPAGATTSAAAAEIEFPAARWVKMQAIGGAAMNTARSAIELCLGLIGTLALFLGVMQIAEKAGLVHALVTVIGPILRPLFPGIPKGHPAMGMVTLNLTANMLGLSNAATPFGIKAMEELQKLNKTTDTATNEMVMLLAMNTAGVQLMPPVFLYAVMGLRASELYVPILIVTGLSLVIAIVSVKLLGMLPAYRASDPARAPAPAMEGA